MPNTPSQSINSKAGASLLGGAVSILVVGLLERYTSYSPDAMEVGAITTLAGFACAWLVPETFWPRANRNLGS